ncbi:MAG TPA: alpha/beta fold hydrolase [Gaiellaceae bacterium]|nr:alpha/beta fold hydrolase [Gaiellaceae bacterium]
MRIPPACNSRFPLLEPKTTRVRHIRERLVLVHGSVVGGRATWSAQAPLADRFELVVLDRPGFPPNEPVERVDFETDAGFVAERLRPGDHLVGHSYGGVVSLLAAARASERLRSLCVLEPPATRVAVGDAAVDAFVAGAVELWERGPRDDPEAFLRRFLAAVGSTFDPPSPLPPELAQGARALVDERGPWEAEIPLAQLAAARIPTLVVSGGHHPAFEAICDVLERALHAERAVLPGYGHAVQRHPRFNDILAHFVERATSGP